jgi:hypothetical protein
MALGRANLTATDMSVSLMREVTRRQLKLPDLLQCGGWCSEWTCEQAECAFCPAERGCPKSAPPPMPPLAPGASMGMCVGRVNVQGMARPSNVIRMTGGGTSFNGHMHPKAAPVGVVAAGDGVELFLLPRMNNPRPSSRNGARAYLGDSCTEGHFSNTDYSAWKVLGKTLSITVDLSQATCGCNAAYYLVAMHQNTLPGTCMCGCAALIVAPSSNSTPTAAVLVGKCDGDFYCDANDICGVRCIEIDLVEANTRAFRTTVHKPTDGGGVGHAARTKLFSAQTITCPHDHQGCIAHPTQAHADSCPPLGPQAWGWAIPPRTPPRPSRPTSMGPPPV